MAEHSGDPAGPPPREVEATAPAVTADVPPAPPAAAAVFGDRLAAATHYAGLLATAGVVRGLIGPREVGRLWDRHLLNCAVVEELVPAGARVVDLGSGAGLPGIPLALARPDLHVTLVEPMARRTSFLDEAVAALELDEQVTVVRSRAEDHARERPRGYDVVTARALAPLDRLLTWAAPLVRRGGVLLAIKGESVTEELRGLPHLDADVLKVGAGIVDPATTVVRIRGEASDRPAPRRARGRAR